MTETTSENLPIISTCKAAQEFNSKYEIKNVLGHGASSSVIRVVERHSGVQFAAKIIDLSLERHDEEESVFYRRAALSEVEVLKKCKGIEEIIQLHDFFESETYAYLVLQLCPSGELFDLHTQHVTFSEKKTRHFMEQILRAVSFLHSHDIVHRDLKLENILLTEDLRLVISDFGFAKIVVKQEKIYETCGTVLYMAPELIRCSMDDEPPGYGREVDLWACGIICFTLLFGQAPFTTERQKVDKSSKRVRRYRQNAQMNLIRRIIEVDYEIPADSAVSDVACDFIRKMLVDDPGKRITAVAALDHPFISTQGSLISHKISCFKKCAIVVLAVIRFKSLLSHGVTHNCLADDPYGTRILRGIINNASFIVYRHWIKIGDDQSSATLFKNTQ